MCSVGDDIRLVLLNINIHGTEEYFDTVSNTRFERYGAKHIWWATPEAKYTVYRSVSDAIVSNQETLESARKKLICLDNYGEIIWLLHSVMDILNMDIIRTIMKFIIDLTPPRMTPFINETKIISLLPGLVFTTDWKMIDCDTSSVSCEDCSITTTTEYYSGLLIDGERVVVKRILKSTLYYYRRIMDAPIRHWYISSRGINILCVSVNSVLSKILDIKCMELLSAGRPK